MGMRSMTRNGFLRGVVALVAVAFGAVGCGGGSGDSGEYGRSVESAWFSAFDANGQFPTGAKWAAAGNPAGTVEGGVAFVEGVNLDISTVKMAVLDDEGTIIAGPVTMTYSLEAFRANLTIPNNPSGVERTLTIGMSAKDPNGRELFEDGEIGTFVQLGASGG